MISRDGWKPFLAAFLGVATFSVMDALMKGASLAVGAYSAMAVRSGIGLLVALPLWRLSGWSRPTPEALKLHGVRGVVCAGMAVSFFHGLTLMPMAEAIALSFIAPLIALFLAAVLLGERIAHPAIWASLLGIGGVLLIAGTRIGNGTADVDGLWGIGWILLSAILFAWNLILQRQQALVASPFEVASFQNAVVGAVLLLFAPWFLTLPESETLSWIGGAAVLAVFSAALLSWAYARAEAQVLVPLEYSAFLWAALCGWLFFGEPLTITTVAGAVLIVAGCWIAAPRKRTEQTQV